MPVRAKKDLNQRSDVAHNDKQQEKLDKYVLPVAELQPKSANQRTLASLRNKLRYKKLNWRTALALCNMTQSVSLN